MKLKVKQAPANVHTELAPACGWSVWNELVSCSDDQTLHKWNLQGDPESKVGWTIAVQLDATRAHVLSPHS